MVQTKKKPTKKQPINVQLSKDDLKELLVVPKNFIVDELLGFHKRDAERMLNLEIAQACLKSQIKTLEQPPVVIPPPPRCYYHQERLYYVAYSEVTGRFIAAEYKCRWCGRVNRKLLCFLTKKEKKALRKLGVIDE